MPPETSPYWNARVRALSPYVPGEQPREKGFIKLNTNENPYPPSPAVQKALRNGGRTLRLYPDPECRALREAIAARFHVKAAQVFVGNGSDEVLAFAFGAFFGETGPAITFPDLTYGFYPVFAALWGVPCETIPLGADFQITIDDYKRPSGGAVIANPNAPTGRALPARDLCSLAAYFRDAPVGARGSKPVLIVDEAYAPFETESMARYIDEYPCLLTVHTLSKAWSLAGLRVGFAIGDEALIEALCRMRDSFNSYPVDRLAQAAAAAALKDECYRHLNNDHVVRTRNRVMRMLAGLGYRVTPSAANFIFVQHPDLDGAALAAALRKERILVRYFSSPRAAPWIRVSMGTDAEMDAFLRVCAGLAVCPAPPRRSK
ncbi:MAG: aminotransferase class I/II-fold pyridoxal phosphate-dependent enzyme [Treponema sp.]|jgi:histidinol-phosphate aminotransferase|nr:aminotransferase class I/II-fold pyridoxal phosphate-dependent enzyme [Treponema sp.]